ncbi:unnamed protein product [Mytilus edulis]|uniref:Novel STAND NTPase 3 domain-containing protein n=1 Tax=Mytilus edulis TaxID=6550 RepID=A0A8S3VJJ9_MYTED|nr:unnamed protein product [Mytilus edulis]
MDEEPSNSIGLKRPIPQALKDEVAVIAAKRSCESAKPGDLDDNQKRWLVVGICLHSVLSPALRTYVGPIITALHNELIRFHKIDAQIYPNHLRNYPPTNVYLNYEAANNNKKKHGNQKAKYDYTITTAVDLSKLFMQTHMALYSGFDETCDSSALLGLIISIDKFAPVVKSDAENIRQNIRNPWAHCDFTVWDAGKYSNSFTLMQNLVKDLKLSLNEEKQIIEDMEKWKIHGSNDNIITIKKELQKVDTYLLNKIDQLEKDMNKGFLEIDERWVAHDITLKNQDKQLGEPGSGKSNLMHHVALKIHSNTNDSIIPCSEINDIINHFKEDKQQMFVLDDICGHFSSSLSDIEYLIKNEDKLKRMLKKGNTKIVATCRLDIYREEIFCKACTVFKSNIFNLSSAYSRKDKLKICAKYLTRSSIELLKELKVEFTPLMYNRRQTSFGTNASGKVLKCPLTHEEQFDSLPEKRYNDSCYNNDEEDNLAVNPLIKSCLRGYNDIARFFINIYDDIKNWYSFNTPLTAACCGGSEKIIKLLLQKGCDASQADGKGQTPLIAACERGNEKIVQLLINKGCNVNQINRMREAPLTAACQEGNLRIVQILIDKGCDVNYVVGMRQTPLTAACSGGNEKIVQLLIAKKCEVYQDDYMGQTPLIAACRGGHKKIVQLLIDKGCDVNEDGDRTGTPLTAAFSVGSKIRR